MATQSGTSEFPSANAGTTLERKVHVRKLLTARRVSPTMVGIAFALVLFGLPLRPYPGHPRPVQEDRVDGPLFTFFYYGEGLAISHFSPSRARLTSSAVLPDAPYVVIVGDSYVEAWQVSDEQTMGSVLEREARRRGQPLNVRQYGWSGDSPAHYVLIASELQRLWKPRLVCAILNADDFTPAALKNHWAEMTLHADGPPTITPVDRGEGGELRAIASALMGHSGLIDTVIERLYLDILPTLDSTKSAGLSRSVEDIEDPRIVDATVEALKRAYGDSLLIVLVQNPAITGGNASTKLESLLRQSCAARTVDCIATRQAFAALRDTKQRFGFGFANTLPQAGHINADGHRLIAELILADYQRRGGGGK